VKSSTDLDQSVATHEIAHGKKLAAGDTERAWGWGTPAGRERAARRGRMLAAGARLGPGMRVLEIGCGTGLFTEMLAHSGASLVAVDISEDLLEKARAKGLPADRVVFLNKRFEDCDVDGPFDAVVGSSILHHLEIEAALAKIHELLKPGGIMTFAEPNMLNPQVFIERKLRFLFPNVSPDETAFTRSGISRLLRDAGFTEIRVIPHGWLHPALPRACMGIVSKLECLLEAIPVVREFAGSLCIRARRAAAS